MRYKKVLITGGAGFVGSSLAIGLKKIFPKTEIIALDNLSRFGSFLNISRLKENNVEFVHGDIRLKEDLDIENINLLIDCSAEASVMAGVTSSPDYLLGTNIIGAINCLEMVRKNKADIIFLSTSRVYPIKKINEIKFMEEKTRFTIVKEQNSQGVSPLGISEKFTLAGARSLYGASKLTAELLLEEYSATYGLRSIINRCGLIAGPWQMGKSDQGIITFWLASHIFDRELSYIGFGGRGKQVRDVLNIDDLLYLIQQQIEQFNNCSGEIFNIGGGHKNTISLQELTSAAQELTGKKVKIFSKSQTRRGDIRVYLTDLQKIKQKLNWQPETSLDKTLEQIVRWIKYNKTLLTQII